jgi:hypothetical protein
MRLLLLAVLWALPLSAQVCGPNDFSGPYGFQFSGRATISGSAAPMAAIGRLTFDGAGTISGRSSVNFNGFFLGNPVTGTYELKPDCTLTWSLQNDSGGWQHFRGTLRPGGNSADFHQIDPGAEGRGVLMRSADGCSAASLRGRYRFAMHGVSTPLGDKPAGERVTQETVTAADGNGNLSWNGDGATNSGAYQVDSDCFVELDFGVKLRGIIVDGGRTVLAVQTDPEQVAAAFFSME